MSKRKSSSPKNAQPLSPVVAAVMLADAEAELRRLDHEIPIIPAASRDQILADTGQVLDAAGRFGWSRVGALTEHASPLLRTLTGVEHITAFQATKNAEPLHRYRNAMLALGQAASLGVGADPAPLNDAIPTLRARQDSLRRPLFDDEILLCRLHFLAKSAGALDDLRAASVYALTDTGLTPGETTQVDRTSFENDTAPSYVLAPGNGHLAARFLDLDGYARAVLGRLLAAAVARGHDPRRPLTYQPRKNLPGSPRATASAQGVLDRAMKALGLHHVDTTASSITQWRVHTVYQQHGPRRAHEVSGRTTEDHTLEALFHGVIPTTAPRALDADEPRGFLD